MPPSQPSFFVHPAIQLWPLPKLKFCLLLLQGEPSRDSSEYEPSTGYSTDDGTPARAIDREWGHRSSLHNSQSDLASAHNGSSRADITLEGKLQRRLKQHLDL